MTNYKTKKIALSEIFEVDKKLVEPKTSRYDLLPFIGLENITSHTREYTEEEGYNPPASNCFYFNEKHILYGKLRPYLNKVYLPEKEGKCSMEILPLLPKNGYNRDFIAALIQSGIVMDMAVKFSTGGRMPRANIDKMMKMIVNLPVDVDVCNEIGLQTKVKMVSQKQMREAVQKQEETVDMLQNSILREVFPYKEGDKLPSDWKWTTLGAIMSMKNGINFGESQKGEGVLTVDVFNMYSDGLSINTDNLYRVRVDLNYDDILQAGDILFVRSSVKKEGVGFPSIFKGLGEKVTYCGFLINGRIADKENVLPEYVCLYLRQGRVRKDVISSAGQTTITNISQGALQGINIALPEKVEIQREIVSKVSERISKVLKVHLITSIQSEAVKALPSAILRQTFAFN